MNKSIIENCKEISSGDFERLLQRLAPERTCAGEKYEELRCALIQFFEWNSCIQAEDLADQTLNRVARRLEKEEIHDIGAFALGVARNIRHEAQNKTRRLIAISELPDQGTSLPNDTNTEREIQCLIDRKRQIGCLDMCLQRLPARERELFLGYHTPKGNPSSARQKLAADWGLTIGALRIKIIRLRERVQKCTQRCSASFWH